MTRLRLDINFDEQRLLAANKDRAAANRAALPERKQRRQVANDKTTPAPARDGTPATPAAEEEPRGGTPDVYTRNKPGAQRRKKVKVLGLELFERAEEVDTVLEANIDWQAEAYDSLEIGGQPTTITRNSSYYVRDLSWFALFYPNIIKNGQLSYTDVYTQQRSLKRLKWTFRHASEGRPAIGNLYPPLPRRQSSPPQLPFALASTVVTRSRYPTLVASNGKKVFISSLVEVTHPLEGILTPAGGSLYDVSRDPNGWNVYSGYIRNPAVFSRAAEEGFPFDNPSNFGSGLEGVDLPPFRMDDEQLKQEVVDTLYAYAAPLTELNKNYYRTDHVALRWEYDIKSTVGTFASTVLGSYTLSYADSGAVSSRGYPIYVPTNNEQSFRNEMTAAFLDGLAPEDPNSHAWQAHKSNVTPATAAALTFYPTRWPWHATYDPTTGMLRANVKEGLTYKVFERQLLPDTSYTAAKAQVPVSSSSSTAYVEAEWKLLLSAPAAAEQNYNYFFPVAAK